MSTQNISFEQKYEKYQIFFICKFPFLVVKFSIYLNRHVFVMQTSVTEAHSDSHFDGSSADITSAQPNVFCLRIKYCNISPGFLKCQNQTNKLLNLYYSLG